MPSVAIVGTRGYPSYYGGFETAVRKLAPHLADQGWDVTVYGRAEATVVDDPDRDGRVHSVQTRGLEKKSLSTLTYGLTSTRHAARRRPDVALVMNVANGFWLPILRRAEVPTVVNVDGIEWERAKWSGAAKWVFRQGARWTAKYGTTLVYDSREIARRWKVEFSRDGVYIPYGGEPVTELPIEPGLTHRGYVLAVARLVPENSIPQFLEAVTQLVKHTDVVLVGSSGYGGALEDEARRLSVSEARFHWLGHISDDRRLLSLWQHAGTYFHGHTVGGTNPALVQAMWCGTPVIARDTPYNREVLGDGGIYVGPSAVELSHVARSVLDNRTLQTELADTAQERAIANFSWAGVCAAYEHSLAALAGGSK